MFDITNKPTKEQKYEICIFLRDKKGIKKIRNSWNSGGLIIENPSDSSRIFLEDKLEEIGLGFINEINNKWAISDISELDLIFNNYVF